MPPTLRETLPWGTHWIYDALVAPYLQRFYDRIAPLRPEAKGILDIGCGPGHLADAIAMTHPKADVVGVDIDPVQVRRAGRNHDRGNLRYVEGASHDVPLADASRDWAVATEAYHHMSHQAAFLAEAHRVLAPGGQFWIVEGAGDLTKDELMAWLGRKPIPGMHRLLRLAWRSHGYTTHTLQDDLLPLVETSPFGDADVERQHGWWIVRMTK